MWQHHLTCGSENESDWFWGVRRDCCSGYVRSNNIDDGIALGDERIFCSSCFLNRVRWESSIMEWYPECMWWNCAVIRWLHTVIDKELGFIQPLNHWRWGCVQVAKYRARFYFGASLQSSTIVKIIVQEVVYEKRRRMGTVVYPRDETILWL